MSRKDLNTIVKDQFLKSVLEASGEARDNAEALLDLMAHQSSIESADDPTNDSRNQNISNLQRKLTAQMAQLRTLNRRLALDNRDTKARTATSRNEIDTLHLSLQNLYYEQRHLRGEIAACESYPHKYTELPLIPIEEFIAKFPELKAANDEEVMRARIKEEQRERTELEEHRLALLKRKQELMSGNAKRKEELVNLDKNLETFIDAAKPIQNTFEKEY